MASDGSDRAISLDRRGVLAGGIATALAGPAQSAAKRPARRAFPRGFLWGTAISAHQSEGNNTNSDAWLMENIRPTIFKDRSGDACDSYHRYEEDLTIAARLGFNCYRLGIEWSRIEPSEGHFSNAELDHYARVLEACRRHGLTPMVTLNHFTTPLWFAARGGFEVADAADLFERYAARAMRHLGGLMGYVTTFNEANIRRLVDLMPAYAAALPVVREALAVAARATGARQFSRVAFADTAVAEPILIDAHRRAYAAIKAARPELPVGLTLTTQAIEPSGADSLAEAYRARLYDDWIAVARSHADFFGVQTYTRILVDAKGVVSPPADAELTAAGYEFYPQALAETIRWAHRTIGKPVFVTESGIATDDDRRRIAFIDAALAGVADCLDEGIPVHSYLYWSLLDNFEWGAGYGVHFGLVAVDRETFRRTPKPSAHHLGAIARANAIRGAGGGGA